jgi:hypothetical protein
LSEISDNRVTKSLHALRGPERLICEAKLNSQKKAAREESPDHPAAIKQKGAVMKKSAAIRSFVTVTLLLAFLIVLPVVRADEWNQATLFTFSQPVQIPGQVLPAGTYLFELVDSFNHEIVRISNADRTNVIAVIQARPTLQKGLSGKAAIVLAERGVSQPEAIVAWSYPGRVEAHQFLYQKQVQEEVAKDKQDTFVFGD